MGANGRTGLHNNGHSSHTAHKAHTSQSTNLQEERVGAVRPPPWEDPTPLEDDRPPTPINQLALTIIIFNHHRNADLGTICNKSFVHKIKAALETCNVGKSQTVTTAKDGCQDIKPSWSTKLATVQDDEQQHSHIIKHNNPSVEAETQN